MTNEIKAGSKLLAEFEELETCTGVECKEANDLCYVKDGKYIKADQFTYHTDYNELHRVWRKMHQIPYHKYKESEEAQSKIHRIGTLLLYGEPLQAFLKIADFIKWYNSLKPKEEK